MESVPTLGGSHPGMKEDFMADTLPLDGLASEARRELIVFHEFLQQRESKGISC